jgi:hypothetical protein
MPKFLKGKRKKLKQEKVNMRLKIFITEEIIE